MAIYDPPRSTNYSSPKLAEYANQLMAFMDTHPRAYSNGQENQQYLDAEKDWNAFNSNPNNFVSEPASSTGTTEKEIQAEAKKTNEILTMLGGSGNYGNFGMGYDPYGTYAKFAKSQQTKGAISGIFGTITDIATMFSSDTSHSDYINELQRQEMGVPEGILEQQKGLEGLKVQGLPGYEALRQRTMNTIPQLMSQFEQLGSTNQVLAELGKAGGRASFQLDSLGIQNEEAKLRNNLALLNFMGNVKAQAEQRAKEFSINKKLAVEQERMLGDKDSAQANENVVSSAMSLIGLLG